MKGQISTPPIGTIGLVSSLSTLITLLVGTALWAPEPALARTAASSEDVMIVTSRLRGGNEDVFWVLHTPSNRLLVYEVNKGGLILGAARNIEWDLLLEELARDVAQDPTLKQVQEWTRGAKSPELSERRKIIAVAGRNHADERDLLYVLDTGSLRQVIYEYHNKTLRIVAARDIRHDMKLDEHPIGKHDPSVSAVRNRVLRSRSLADAGTRKE
ncbi:MAG: hypothetical protein O7H41_10905 [Planctomycetota bacterium]|nr:hypothetical protein [Planctomycetota bacterium]